MLNFFAPVRTSHSICTFRNYGADDTDEDDQDVQVRMSSSYMEGSLLKFITLRSFVMKSYSPIVDLQLLIDVSF